MMTASKMMFYAGCLVALLLPALNGGSIASAPVDHAVPMQQVIWKAPPAWLNGPIVQAWSGYPIVGQGVPHYFGKHGLLFSYGTTYHASLQRAYLPESGLQLIDRLHAGQLPKRATSALAFKTGANKRGPYPAT